MVPCSRHLLLLIAICLFGTAVENLAVAQADQGRRGTADKDILIYLDGSATIVKAQESAPSKVLADMLVNLLTYSDEHGRFLRPNDNISIFTFGDEITPLAEVANADSDVWRNAIAEFRALKKGDDKTDFREVFVDLRRRIKTKSSTSSRPIVVLIASDFVHEISYSDPTVCHALDAYRNNQAIPAGAELNQFLMVVAERAVGNHVTFAGLLRESPKQFQRRHPTDPIKDAANLLLNACALALVEKNQNPIIERLKKEPTFATDFAIDTIAKNIPQFVKKLVQEVRKRLSIDLKLDAEPFLVGDSDDVGLRIRIVNPDDVGVDLTALALLSKAEVGQLVIPIDLPADRKRVPNGSLQTYEHVFQNSDQRKELFKNATFSIRAHYRRVEGENAPVLETPPQEIQTPAVQRLAVEVLQPSIVYRGEKFFVRLAIKNNSYRSQKIGNVFFTLRDEPPDRSPSARFLSDTGPPLTVAPFGAQTLEASLPPNRAATLLSHGQFKIMVTDDTGMHPPILVSLPDVDDLRLEGELTVQGRPSGAHKLDFKIQLAGTMPSRVTAFGLAKSDAGEFEKIAVPDAILLSPVRPTHRVSLPLDAERSGRILDGDRLVITAYTARSDTQESDVRWRNSRPPSCPR